MTDQQRAEWIARQTARFQPGDLDAGLEVVRRRLRRNRIETPRAA
ncbi:hypothetical protein PBI_MALAGASYROSE_42 [Mycobacterium phage MalagasyRose]|uniref:Uncharacterized protein n=1 Tax=Mycobacterium phage MalagasyRose TaxID=2599870 RepID=A0A5J6TEA8_9CAUD|nr:hypothetical protein QEH39_gp46 [Mycobacterium phage MalagasyRose]QFG08935.1 hypothetical protein PBI_MALAGASYROSE_42 [Mycobacterium phage MalagasyRose]